MTKEIIIENNTTHKGKSHRRPFTCQVFEAGNKRTYVLDETKRDVMRSHFVLAPGCRIIDNGVSHVIEDIWYSRQIDPGRFLPVHFSSRMFVRVGRVGRVGCVFSICFRVGCVR